MGRMTDPAYRALVLDASDQTKHDCDALKRYLDIASLAHRFCMDSVEAWALDQFKQVVGSAKRISQSVSSHKDLLDALLYCKNASDRELEHNVRNMLQCYLQISTQTRYDPSLQDTYKVVSLAQLYQNRSLKQQDPALFGHIFCVVLSAGYQSFLWQMLTREARSKLLAAQVYLTPLPPTLPTTWIHRISEIAAAIDAKTHPNCFHQCNRDFESTLNRVFDSALYSGLTKDSPLAGVTSISKLATYRQLLAENLSLAVVKCKCRSQLLSVFDLKMNTLFTELAEKYHDRLD
jgi:hypothetical protein